jgi:hypothetical protein
MSKKYEQTMSRSLTAGLSHSESRVPLWFWFWFMASAVLIYSHFVTDSWTRLTAVLLFIPCATLFVGLSGMIIGRGGLLLASLASLTCIFSILFH